MRNVVMIRREPAWFPFLWRAPSIARTVKRSRHHLAGAAGFADQRRKLILATERLMRQPIESVAPVVFAHVPEMEVFPTLADVERAAIVAAYQRSNRKPLEAARLLGIGKTTLYRKLREIREAAA